MCRRIHTSPEHKKQGQLPRVRDGHQSMASKGLAMGHTSVVRELSRCDTGVVVQPADYRYW